MTRRARFDGLLRYPAIVVDTRKPTRDGPVGTFRGRTWPSALADNEPGPMALCLRRVYVQIRKRWGFHPCGPPYTMGS